MQTPKILTLDIETSPLVAFQWGLRDKYTSIEQIIEQPRVLGWAAKWHGKPVVEWRSEYHHGRQDMIGRAHELMSEADILVHFNGTQFDVPWLKGEAAVEGLKPPAPFQEIDLMKVARKNFRFPSYKLAYLVKRFGLPGKLSTGGFTLWRECLLGDDETKRKAWARMRRYCKNDTAIEEDLYNFLLPWITNHPSIGLWTGEDCCDKCGGKNLERRGYRRTRLATYQAYRCRDCGGWSQGSRRLSGVELRGTA